MWIGTLPPGSYAPDRNVFTIAQTYRGTYTDLLISPNGNIYVIPAHPPASSDYAYVSLDGIVYNPQTQDPFQPSRTIHLTGWSPAPYSTRTPAWFDDAYGVIHLEGAAQPAGGSNLIGSVPFDAAPPSNVFTIVHTYGGTYADLEIDTLGNISLIGPHTPAFLDHSFVSLEGINYLSKDTAALGWVNQQGLVDPRESGGFAGSGAPTAQEDLSGFVHLSGSIINGPFGGLYDGRFQGAEPSATVYTIAHTFAGTYTDLAISSGNGAAINLIPPPSPLLFDPSFMSLEGITYAAASPKFFALAAHGSEKRGATLMVTLRKRRQLALVLQAVRGHRLVQLGVVRLGRHRAGRSQIRWNLRVNGHPLRAGRYEVTLSALNGKILSPPAYPGARTLIVLSGGHVRVQR